MPELLPRKSKTTSVSPKQSKTAEDVQKVAKVMARYKPQLQVLFDRYSKLSFKKHKSYVLLEIKQTL